MELTIGQLIKIVLGLAVIVLVVGGVILFGGQFIDFVKNVIPGNATN